MRLARALFSATCGLVICVLSVPSWGATENEKNAQAAFVEAMKLMSAKRYGEACASFARSQELDPGMGTQFRLAECYEKLGRLASAYEQYVAVAEAAKVAKKKDREVVARKRAAALELQVAKLTIDIAPSVASLVGVEVLRDGVVVSKESWGTPIPVDTGDHVVTVRAPRKLPFERKIWADGSAKLLVSVAALGEPPKPKSKPPGLVPLVAFGGVGVLGLGLGIGAVVLRSGKASDAQGLHDKIVAASGNCGVDRPVEFTTDCDALSSATSAGDMWGTVSVVSFVVSGVSLAGLATYLLWPEAKAHSEPEAAVHFTPTFGPGFGGAMASGTF